MFSKNTLTEHRLKLNLTQAQVAYALGLQTAGKISHWESGSKVPCLMNALKLSKLFGVSLEVLYGEVVLQPMPRAKRGPDFRILHYPEGVE